jgi:hypothetical protein
MSSPPFPLHDLGHQGEIDRTQIDRMLRLTPTERLHKHESWRLFIKKATKARTDAELRRDDRGGSDPERG